MGHGIYESDFMFSNTEVPWHGLGTVTDGALNAADAIRIARLDWGVGKEEIYRYRSIDPEIDFAALSENAQNRVRELCKSVMQAEREMKELGLPVAFGKLQQLKAHAVTVRLDKSFDDPASTLGIVGCDYATIGNAASFDLVDRVVGKMGATYETAGSLFNGKKVFLLARCPNDIKIGEDIIRPYLLLNTAHDGTSALEVKLTLTRVVCNNTLAIAVADQSSASVRVKHTSGNVDASGNVKSTVVKDVRDGIQTKVAQDAEKQGSDLIISAAHEFMAQQAILLNRLADTHVDARFVANYLECLIPSPLDGRGTRSENRRKQLRDIFYGIQPGDKIPHDPESKQQSVMALDQYGGGTGYRLYNSATHFNDHVTTNRITEDKATGEKKTFAESRFTRIMDTGGFREDAMRLLVEGIDTRGKSLADAVAAYREKQKEVAERKLVMTMTN